MNRKQFFVLGALFVLVVSPALRAAQIYGDYIETRSADVYTGPCVANGEVGLAGDQAILGWRVEKGSWNGVVLDGLSVVGVAKAKATLGDPHGSPFPARSVLIVDERASADQRLALASFAQTMAGELLLNALQVEVAPIRFEMQRESGHPVKGLMQAGTIAGVETRLVGEKDHLCGNETTYYSPLAATSHAMPSVALMDQYKGSDLGVSWSVQGKRSAFVGSFSR
jgi:hypothetical protein